MARNWLRDLRKHLVLSCAVLTIAAGVSRAADPQTPDADLKAKVDAQQREIDELKAMIRGGQIRSAAAEADPKADPAAPKPVSEDQVKKILEGYLKDHPGVGVPSGVQTGFENGKGFVVRSAPDSKWDNWSDGSKIPFELRIRGRLQMVYDFYKVTDTINHQSNAPANGGNNSSPDFSQLEVKRMRIIFEGTAFDPNLRYHIQLDGNTRGLGGNAGGAIPNGNGFNTSGGIPGDPDGAGAVTVDHAVRLFSAFIAYDWHPCGYEKGCGPDCPDGTYRYTPTITGIAGKIKPMVAFEEYLGSGNQQFVEYGIGNWFFDADDDNLQMAAGVQVKAMDDRFFFQGLVTNGNESQTANLQMDDLPGINVGGWYDFGGTWNADRKRWDLFGDCLSDIDWSCNPVVRVGAAANLVPMDRRSEFTQIELGRVRAIGAGVGGTTLIGELNGGTVGGAAFVPQGAAGIGQFAVDAFDSYTFDTYIAAKWRGFSIYNEWWVRDLDNFRGRREPAGAYPGNGINGPILYNTLTGTGATGPLAVFPGGRGVIDYGSQLQAGYFLIPKKLEIAGRWSYLRGQSGSVNGNGTFTTLSTAQKASVGIPTATTVEVVNGAFRTYHEADEFAVGVNYYFKRHNLKWQNDFSVYTGGNPAAGGQSPAGFIPGVDGWLFRSQIQLGF